MRAMRKRLIIRINKVLSNNEPYMRLYEHVQDQLDPIVYEIAPRTKLGTFNGYDHVTLTHGELQDIINHDEPEWRTALSAVKAVYVITDRNTGNCMWAAHPVTMKVCGRDGPLTRT